MLEITRDDLLLEGEIVQSLLDCEEAEYTAGFVIEYDMTVWVAIDARSDNRLFGSRQFRPTAIPNIMKVLRERGEVAAFLERFRQQQEAEFHKIERQVFKK